MIVYKKPSFFYDFFDLTIFYRILPNYYRIITELLPNYYRIFFRVFIVEKPIATRLDFGMNYFHFVIGNIFLLSILQGEAGNFFYFSKNKKEKNMECFFDEFYIIDYFLVNF